MLSTENLFDHKKHKAEHKSHKCFGVYGLHFRLAL